MEDLGPAEIGSDAPFVFVGRMTSEKDPLMLARAAAKSGVRVAYIGDGPLADDLRRLDPSAEVTGWIEAAEARRRLREARAVVMTSRWFETQGMIVPEAFAAGIPAIVPSTSSASAAVENGITGLIFRGGDESDLAASLSALLDIKRAQTMGREAYVRFWADPPTLSRHLDGLEEVYSGCSGGRA
jgi:glycosyltransferase involved in cell wall biosynthesis